ncbi:2-polyprenylphenol 6-hydroxylase [Aestuariivirga sp.]|uniref:2-polyprenylphenol 6-hydroxylase n=1 Tax=Aestuariivirga sp. TaxID=2650926 RepID=UPI0039E35402
MWGRLGDLLRLMKAGRTLARYDALLLPEQIALLPWPARFGLKMAKFGTRSPDADAQSRLTMALSSLGPSYIKLGQFLATRPDVVGPKRAFELKALQDRLPPFPQDEARAIVSANLGGPVEQFFSEFGPPVAAASIAQVHRARTGDGRDVAVKVLRPGVEKRFAADLSSFYLAARVIERTGAEGRRLRPVDAVAMLEQSMKLELDLRMEASAISEMRGNTKDDQHFRLPLVDWPRTARQVLTTEWIDGTPISEITALKAQGFDLDALADTVIQSFLRHAIRDGFFHADMHQGNLFVDRAGNLVAVDFGITGRLNAKERLFLAEILYGFITRDYLRVSQVHFDAGYVPAHQDVATFAQAIRAIGEPIMDRPAGEISMARLLTQLFEVTAQFDMTTQPQLLLLQKTMVVVEGVARTLNPDLNMWKTAEPVVKGWIERQLGPVGRVENMVETLGRMAATLPALLDETRAGADVLSRLADGGGIRLDPETTKALAKAQARETRWTRYALAAGALALVVIAWRLLA